MRPTLMVSSTSTPDDNESPAPAIAAREERLETVAAQIAAIDELIGLATQKIQVFDFDLAEGGWNGGARIDALASFMRRARNPRFDVIVHDTRWIETSGARLVQLLRTFGHAMTIYKTGPEAASAMDPLIIVDQRHYLHRYHVSQRRATLSIGVAQAAMPFVNRFEEIWATGQPGLSGTVLGL